MKNYSFILLLITIISCQNSDKKKSISSQTPTVDEILKYDSLVKTASNLYNSKDYLKSSQTYSKAFRIKQDSRNLFNAACSWTKANSQDSAFVQLYSAAENHQYSRLDILTSDRDLLSLHKDDRWSGLLELVKKNIIKKEALLDKPLMALLDDIDKKDQNVRGENIDWKKMHEVDSLNLIQIKSILDTRGWLGKDIIGRKGNTTLFLVIQHADLATQEQYLPMMREAVKKQNAYGSQLALLEDRVAMRNDKLQIYGSQIHSNKSTGEKYIYPIIDPDNVDKRRAKVGLGDISSYAARFDLIWDLEAHKAMTAEINKAKENAIMKN